MEPQIIKLLETQVDRYDPQNLFGDRAEKVDQTLRWCEKNQCQILSLDDKKLVDFVGLNRLREISDAPRLLFVLGDVSKLDAECIGVVGARRASAAGVRAAISLSRSLAESKFVIVSGLAKGVDAAAHRGVLYANGKARGNTVAVLGHGLDRIYPAENWALSRDILSAGGCLISEYPPGVPPLKHHFPQRNRLIAGLSRAVVVVEATERSGSLITAKLALEQNRDVFALPGTFDDAGYLGNHRLLQEGAKLVIAVEDILAEYNQLPIFTESLGIPPSFQNLHRLFKPFQNTASLESLFIASRNSLTDLLQILEKAKAQGFVHEIGPQQFSWVYEVKEKGFAK
jgi:DNA protecting protein DprA